MTMRRRIFVLLTGIAALAPLCASPADRPVGARLSYAVADLDKPAEILIDHWGVPHIYAGSLYDAFFVQGFAAARDRLWQMDLWRKRGLGEMAGDFGPAYAEGDRMARAFLFRGDMYREWLAYGSDAKRVAEAFVAGVNAFVEQTKTDPALLPLEFRLLGYAPARWQAEDIVRIRHHGLTLNFTSEVDRAAAYCNTAGDRIDWLRRELDPAIAPAVPEGLDACAIPGEELKRAYALATAAPRFTKEMLKLGAKAPLQALYAVAEDTDAALRSFGSNNWTIAPGKTTTGRPILANDPHRAHGAPGLRYISHLVAPGMNVIGAGEPFLPGISIGHNGTISFGLTRFYMDQEDLYVYELNPQNAEEYRYQGRWEPFQTLSEDIAVKGEAPRKVAIKFTRHGPLLHIDAKNHRAYALRAAWLEAGMAPYFGSMDYMRAANWDQFRAAMNRWGAPGENQVYADRHGNIGWLPGGLTPIRPNWDGLFPVPGDGRYEWAGYRHMDELPWEFNPARGYVVTANENNIPREHPAMRKGVGYEWSDAARSQRLKSIFASKSRFSLEDSERMQTDTVSTQAQRVIKLLAGLGSPDPRVAEGLALLRGWDGNVHRDSAAAALFEVWFTKHLRPAAVQAALGDSGARLAGSGGDAARVILMLEDPGRMLRAGQRDEILVASLKPALDEISAKLGPDMKSWKWGSLHAAVFNHPLAGIVDDAARAKLNVGSFPIGGSGFTPMNTAYRNSDFQLTAGASFRMVLDVGRWDRSRVVNTPGQSGDPESANYRNLAPLWADGKYFPLLYSRAAIERETVQRIRLTPAR